MKSSLNPAKKSKSKIGKKTGAFFVISIILFSILFNTPIAQAQLPVTDVMNLASRIQINAGDKILTRIGKTLAKAATVSFQQLFKTALNKIAKDTAVYLGSGGRGQKPLFVTKDWGDYLTNIANQSAGQFIENFVSSVANDIASPTMQKEYGECAEWCKVNYYNCGMSEEEYYDLDDDDDDEDDAYKEWVCYQEQADCIKKCQKSFNDSKAANSTTTASTTTAPTRKIVNVCQPSSLQATLKISLGLSEQTVNMPNCSATKMIQNWGDYYTRLYNFENWDFLNMVENAFNPVSNDLGIWLTLRSDLTTQAEEDKANNKLKLIAKGGWNQVTNIAKEALGVPNDAASKAEFAQKTYWESIGKVTGDIVIDAANIFLNQISLSAFNNIMATLGEKAQSNKSLTSSVYNSDPTVSYGEVKLRENISTFIPNLTTETDYNVLIGLSSCPDPKKPGPTECVIDNLFMQAITEKKTVGEALKSGYLNKDWIFSKNNINNAYTLRNISILRKYRILPLVWEQVIEEIYKDVENRKNTTLGDLVACFNKEDSYGVEYHSKSFNINNTAWCEGLVDPNWVLKAPLNYCSKKGIGSQITAYFVADGNSQGGVVIPSVFSLTRADDYCADEKTCIKENSKGGCDVYGYCNEEKRTWNFSSDSCEPIYNTCQTFTNKDNNKQFSYLQNTLDYGDCNSENAGCSQYSFSGVFSASTNTISWDVNKSMYLTKADNCNSVSEGCTELIRVKSPRGANLIMNAGFENDKIGSSSVNQARLNDWPLVYAANAINASRSAVVVDVGGIDSANPNGDKALELSAQGSSTAANPLFAGVHSTPLGISLLPVNFEFIFGEYYTLSADVYLSKGEKALVYMGPNATSELSVIASTTNTSSWQNISITRAASAEYNIPLFGVQVANSQSSSNAEVKVYIKNIKFELVNGPKNNFSLYGEYKVYQKLIPPYLESVCYANEGSDYKLKSDAPNICNNFTRRCNADEAGCELFTNSRKSLKVAAQVTGIDKCPADCVGYDVYISKKDYFNSPQAENIIPDNLTKCSAAAVGCNEFTNLDTVEQGGENREYYSELKQCIKPEAELCASFYNWERTANGSQLRSYTLEKNVNEYSVIEPKSIDDDPGSSRDKCNAEIYKKLPGTALYNPDCKEFYNVNGEISYQLLSKTITCSDNCVSYRLSNRNIDNSLSIEACGALKKTAHWDASTGCNTCLNGGVWDNKLGSCIYQAIPGEGKKCSSNQVSCREYNGGDGNNIKVVSSYDFESGLQGWNSNCSNGLERSQIANNKNGHSLLYKNSAYDCSPIGFQPEETVGASRLINKVFASDDVAAQLVLGQTVAQNKAYNLRFIARSNTDAHLKAYFYNNNQTDPKKSYFTDEGITIQGGGAWNIYQINLNNLDHEVGSNEVLVITADKDFYFDEVVLTEISDRYYLIKGSGQVPPICSYDINSKYKGDKYNLGCTRYLDRAGNYYNLRKFSKLCSNSSIGCEQMIETHNYDPYQAGVWDDNKNKICEAGENCVVVPADEAIYAIYDSSKNCKESDKGCSLMGKALSGVNTWSDVYKKNNPNVYNDNICRRADLGCSAWDTTTSGTSYFKDPDSQTCQYRNSKTSSTSGKAWYLIPVNRCDINKNNKIDIGETQICRSNNDCSEGSCIVDNNDYPCEVSYFKTFGPGGKGNSIPTPINKAGLCEVSASGCTEYIDPVSAVSPNLVSDPDYNGGVVNFWNGDNQTISIEPNKMYTFSVQGYRLPTGLQFDNDINQLIYTNLLGSNQKLVTVNAGASANIIFFSKSATKVTITGGEKNKKFKLNELVVNYQIKDKIDKGTCQSVDIDNGCILFNERSVNSSAGPVSLAGKWDAFNSLNNKAPLTCATNGVNCSANQLIKVAPNRVCSKWLDCLSYIIDDNGKKVCYAVGECNRLDGSDCANFEEIEPNKTINFNNNNVNKNATGYYSLNQYHLANMKEVGLNTDAHYDFEDIIPILSCEKFDGGPCGFGKGIKELLIREPSGAPVTYPAHGETYLKVPANNIISPHNGYIDVLPGKDYYINFLINTENGGQGVLRLTAKDSKGDTTFSEKAFSANNGWSREVFSFNVRSFKQIKIYLSMSESAESGAVYFDDINIEPVLKVADNKYISKECRLYPTDNSLTCVNKNNSVVKDGLEGYCLEHDPLNKNVCLLWYPVDKISATQISRNSEGYNGKFPLNYCTEVDGNFELVKKLTAYRASFHGQVGEGDIEHHCSQFIADDWTKALPNDALGEQARKQCAGNYRPIIAWGRFEKMHSYGQVFCVPKNENLFKDSIYTVKTISDMNACNGLQYYEGWAKYDGALQKQPFVLARSGADYCNKHSDPWCLTTEGLNESSIDNPVRVLDYNNFPADEDGLKLLSGNDPEKVFRLGCNNFIQLVSSTGENKAWADRVSANSEYATKTPKFLVDYGMKNGSYTNLYGSSTVHNIQSYGRLREDVPFGAALWPDSFDLLNNEGSIKLRNQFSSKNKEDVLAGRPYGCSNYKEGEVASGCDNIGYCSLNPNVYCLTAAKLLEGDIQISVDNKFDSWINGKYLVGSTNIGLSKVYVKNLIKGRKYVLAIKATDTADVKENFWGISASIENVMNTNSVSGWKCTSTPQVGLGWARPEFNDSSWPAAVFAAKSCSNCPSNRLDYKQIWSKEENNRGSRDVPDLTIYCRYSFDNIDSYASKKTCSEGGYGTCIPLWDNYLGNPVNDNKEAEPDFKSILGQLFLKSYGSYILTGQSYSLGTINIDKLAITTKTKPIINNVKFTNASSSPDAARPITDRIAPVKGLYRLEFTTVINKEQQPLKEIHINWGDGSEQIIKGYDSRSNSESPHVFYHFYSGPSTSSVKIDITDNWEMNSQ